MNRVRIKYQVNHADVVDAKMYIIAMLIVKRRIGQRTRRHAKSLEPRELRLQLRCRKKNRKRRLKSK